MYLNLSERISQQKKKIHFVCTLRWCLQSVPWSHVFHIQVGHAQYSQCFRMTSFLSLGLSKDKTSTWCQQENTNETVLDLSKAADLRLWRRKPHADAPSIGSNCWCWLTPVQVHSTAMICWNETKRPQVDESFGYYTICTLDGLFQKLTKHVLQFILKLFILQNKHKSESMCFKTWWRSWNYKWLPGKVPPTFPRQGFKNKLFTVYPNEFPSKPLWHSAWFIGIVWDLDNGLLYHNP